MYCGLFGRKSKGNDFRGELILAPSKQMPLMRTDITSVCFKADIRRARNISCCQVCAVKSSYVKQVTWNRRFRGSVAKSVGAARVAIDK
jgi:hypothetical protein